MDDVIVYPSDLAHVRFAGKTGLCMRGCRQWAARHGIDWAEFVRSGIPASVLLATNDAGAAEAVDVARRRLKELDNGR
ncbi:MAG: hypothetical protein FWH15_09525 [Betaproteobacteria bacterium]|nr:hypothetical protein [Betaproteobacteria bacterium]